MYADSHQLENHCCMLGMHANPGIDDRLGTVCIYNITGGRGMLQKFLSHERVSGAI